mgnify:CR=1 FL=1
MIADSSGFLPRGAATGLWPCSFQCTFGALQAAAGLSKSNAVGAMALLPAALTSESLRRCGRADNAVSYTLIRAHETR